MRYRQWLIRSGLIIFMVLSGRGETFAESDSLFDQLRLFADALEIIQEQHVEEVDTRKLIHGALRGMLASLDPHSQFMDPDLFRELQIQTRGYFGGLGMVVTMKDNFLTVISPLEGTPASRAGIKAKDIIIKIGDEPTKDMILMEAVKKLRGPKGTPVTITVIRNRERLPEITLIREIIELPIIQEARIIEEGIGYIHLVSFREDTARELGEALRKLEGEGMEALILDLRGNAGGLLGAAVNVADKFLPPGKKIVSTRGRAGANRRDYFAREEPYTNYPLVVLVDGASASASEIVAGAIQDGNRGIIIGTETFGKASVQTLIPLGDGSVLRLTTAKYFTPQGRSLEDEGIIPDIIVEGVVDEVGEGLPPQQEDEINEVEEEDPEKEEILDPQLRQALNILKAWPIFRAIYSPGESREAK